MTSAKTKYATWPLAALIREAPLKTQQKVLLFVIASHHKGRSFGRADTLQRHTGMGRTTFYKVRSDLIEQGILENREVAGRATTYTIRRTALERIVAASTTRRTLPTSGTPTAATTQTTPAAPRHTTPAPTRHQKQNTKKNNQESMNLKERPDSSDQASAESGDSSRRVRRPKSAASSMGRRQDASAGQTTTSDVRKRLAATKAKWQGAHRA